MLLTNFDLIKQKFDNLNIDKSHFVNSNDICTPMDCVKEMVDSIPENFWQQSNLKILDSCCGNGNFFAYIALKTPLSNLYFNEINPKRIANVYDYFGKNINLTTQDFLTFNEIYSNENDKFDLVVSNPPYAKFNNSNDKRVSKNHNLSRDFIFKALQITKKGGYILFVVPNNWMSFSDRNILPKLLSNYQFLYLDIGGAKKYFKNVGSSFTWFLLQKIDNTKPFLVNNNYVFKNDLQSVILDKNSSFIPLYYSEIVRSILNKTINNKSLPKYNIQTSSNLHKTTKKQYLSNAKNDEFKYKIIHTPTQTIYSKQAHIYQNGYKVFLSLTNQFQVFIDNCGMTQSIAFIRCENKAQAEQIKTELEQPIYKFLNNITRYGNFNNVRVLQNFPKWNSFELTPQENDFINNFNQLYYKNHQAKKLKT